jgi:hypothetical protein
MLEAPVAGVALLATGPEAAGAGNGVRADEWRGCVVEHGHDDAERVLRTRLLRLGMWSEWAVVAVGVPYIALVAGAERCRARRRTRSGRQQKP